MGVNAFVSYPRSSLFRSRPPKYRDQPGTRSPRRLCPCHPAPRCPSALQVVHGGDCSSAPFTTSPTFFGKVLGTRVRFFMQYIVKGSTLVTTELYINLKMILTPSVLSPQQ